MDVTSFLKHLLLNAAYYNNCEKCPNILKDCKSCKDYEERRNILKQFIQWIDDRYENEDFESLFNLINSHFSIGSIDVMDVFKAIAQLSIHYGISCHECKEALKIDICSPIKIELNLETVSKQILSDFQKNGFDKFFSFDITENEILKLLNKEGQND